MGMLGPPVSLPCCTTPPLFGLNHRANVNMLPDRVALTLPLHSRFIPQQELVSEMGPSTEQSSKDVGPRTGKSVVESWQGLSLLWQSRAGLGRARCLAWSWGLVSRRKVTTSSTQLRSFILSRRWLLQAAWQSWQGWHSVATSLRSYHQGVMSPVHHRKHLSLSLSVSFFTTQNPVISEWYSAECWMEGKNFYCNYAYNKNNLFHLSTF